MGNIQSKKLLKYSATGIAAVAATILYIWLGHDQITSTTTTSSAKKLYEPGKKTQTVLGLSNFGTSCYLNALLQALAASRHYCEYVRKYEDVDRLGSTRDFKAPSFRIFSALSTANKYINRDIVGNDLTMSFEVPRIVFSALKAWNSLPMEQNQEQDTHEVFNVITNALTDEQRLIDRRNFFNAIQSVQAITPPLPHGLNWMPKNLGIIDSDNNDNTGVLNLLGKSAFDNHIVTRSSVVDQNLPSTSWTDWNNPFAGRFAISLECLMCCAKMPLKFEYFNDLTLTIPQNREHECLTLSDLIQHYFAHTIVYSVDCDKCSKLAGKPLKSAFAKRMCMTKLPRSLCFHINRAVWNCGGSRKRFDYIPFEEILDMSVVEGLLDIMKINATSNGSLIDCVNDTNYPDGEVRKEVINSYSPAESGDAAESVSNRRLDNCKYKLMSVICHTGDVFSGHFVTFRRSPEKLKSSEGWFMVSDTTVAPVSLCQVFFQHAYMLIYDKIN